MLFSTGRTVTNLGDDPEHGAARQDQHEAHDHGQAPFADEERAQHTAQHSQHASGEAEHARRREHHVVRDADQCVDRSYRQTVGDDRCEHGLAA